jgi:glutathione peroxidase-family protein
MTISDVDIDPQHCRGQVVPVVNVAASCGFAQNIEDCAPQDCRLRAVIEQLPAR